MSFKCPQCGSMECGPIRCRFTMKDHKDMSACREDAPSGFTRVLPASVYGRRAVSPNDTVHGQEDALLPTPHAAPQAATEPYSSAITSGHPEKPAASAPDIGYECAWPK